MLKLGRITIRKVLDPLDVEGTAIYSWDLSLLLISESFILDERTVIEPFSSHKAKYTEIVEEDIPVEEVISLYHKTKFAYRYEEDRGALVGYLIAQVNQRYPYNFLNAGTLFELFRFLGMPEEYGFNQYREVPILICKHPHRIYSFVTAWRWKPED